jgi:hypothetical protein
VCYTVYINELLFVPYMYIRRHKSGKFARAFRVSDFLAVLSLFFVLCLIIWSFFMSPSKAEEMTQDENPCVQVLDGKWNCTPTSTIIKIGREYPNGIKWSNKYDTLSVEDKIRWIAEEEHFDAEDYLVALAKCESNFNPLAMNFQNNKPSGSIDRGLFQVSSHWQKQVTNAQAFSIEWSTKWTIDKLKDGGAKLWACNRLIDKSLKRK